MIRELRARHRAVFVALACALPLGFGFAISSRSRVPPVPIDPSAAAVPSGAPAIDTLATAGQVALRLRMWDPGADGACALELTPSRDLELPDVLVYWAESGTSDELPRACVLLGPLAGTRPSRYRLPKRAPGAHGRLYLYSLGHQELAASLELPR